MTSSGVTYGADEIIVARRYQTVTMNVFCKVFFLIGCKIYLNCKKAYVAGTSTESNTVYIRDGWVIG